MSEEAKNLIEHLDNDAYRRLNKFKILELNADGQPMSYCPLSTMTWQEIMFLIVKGEVTGVPRINVLELYDDPDAVVRTALREFQLPSVVSHLEFIPRPNIPPFTKFNVFLRDNFTCQYSGEVCDPVDLTFDHIVPQSKNGKTTWENIATAKRSINELKDNLTLKEFRKAHGYNLLRAPYQPGSYELLNKGKSYPPKFLHESWVDYLYWDSEIE